MPQAPSARPERSSAGSSHEGAHTAGGSSGSTLAGRLDSIDRMRAGGLVGLVVAGLVFGCGGGREDMELFTTSRADSDTGASGSTGDPDAISTSSDGSGDSVPEPTEGTGGDDGPKFDLGTSDVAVPTGESCQKVDLLFIIDNSGSMADEQDNITASFPGFINGMLTTLEDAESYHVGVVTTDPYSGNAPGCTMIGSLVTQTSGTDSSNAVCTPFADGFRFMTENDDLAAKFTCAAKPGTAGSGDERPMDAVRAALSANLNAPGACNAEFLRDDALLVLVFITDEEDDHEIVPIFNIQMGSDGNPPDWFADVVARKAGIEENVVVLSLVGHPKPNACPDFQWDGFDGAEIATRIIEFTHMFTHGFVGDVCAADYTPFFDEALAVIDTACNDFTPPG
jgi:hypothetical protein